MRVLSWIGGIILVAVISTATAATLRGQNEGARGLTPAQPVAAAPSDGTSYSPDLLANHHPPRPSPSPSPSPATSSVPAAPAHAAPAPPRPAIVIGSTQQVLINRDRASVGLPPLTWSSCLHNVAVSNAVRLSNQGWVPPYHTNGPTLDLGCRLGNQAGENVGYWSGGINDAQLNAMFWASAEHRANILGPYHYVATAWAVASNGYAYIAVEFS
jgi:uncharacterized protein YkwD